MIGTYPHDLIPFVITSLLCYYAPLVRIALLHLIDDGDGYNRVQVIVSIFGHADELLVDALLLMPWYHIIMSHNDMVYDIG
jgi:hypothetical protein